MRNLIRFIDTYSFFFLFLLFEVFAFYLLFSNNHFQQSSFLNSSNSISGKVFDQYSSFTDYLNLKDVNSELAEENRKLRANQINSFHRIFGENIYIADTIYERQYHFARAKVINNSINKQNNYLTLNIGSENGILSGMGVLGPNGVVGVIKNVSNNYATVLSVLHSRAKISCKLKKTDYFGSMQWDGADYREGLLNDIPNHVNIQVGDTVITSGFSSTFPEGILVGTIQDYEKPEGENFYEIKIKFSLDFKNISHVYIVKNNFQIEQKQLEEETEEEND